MDEISKRIKCTYLLDRVVEADRAAEFITSGMNVAMSSDVTAVVDSIVKAAERRDDFEINIWSGLAWLEADRKLGPLGMIGKRTGQQVHLRSHINQGRSAYSDEVLGSFYQNIRRGDYGTLDMAVVEAVAINEKGDIIPSHHLCDLPNFVQAAQKIIIQLNTAYPAEIEGLHDIYLPENPPHRGIIPITKAGDRIGTTSVPVETDKIACIVPSDRREPVQDASVVDSVSESIASNIMDYLRAEVKHGRLGKSLLPLEIGLGSVSKAILRDLQQSEFNDLEFYSAILNDGVLDLIDKRKVRTAVGNGLFLTESGEQKFFQNIEEYKKYIVLRPLEITDCPEIIRRLGVIAINGAIETDIYGNINSSHVGGGKIVSGIGGAIDFALNAYLSVFTMPSITKKGASCIVPMASHVDIPEHGVNVIVTEQGAADLRGGLSPEERAVRIIENCAHPRYRPILKEYLMKAKQAGGGHEPQLLKEAFSFLKMNEGTN